MAASWIWLNGSLVRGDLPHLSVADRGFQLGDGVFETLAVHRGVAIQLQEHLARLRASGAAMDLHLPFSDDQLSAGIGLVVATLAGPGRDAPPLADAARGGLAPTDRGTGDPGDPATADPATATADPATTDPVAAEPDPVPDTAVRITVSRGASPGRGLLPPVGMAATVVIQAWPAAEPTELVRRGVRAVFSPIRHDPRSPLAGVKTTSRADHVWARLDAARRGADDAIFLTTDGELAESTQANVWIARGNRLLTPPLAAGILAGTTRRWLLTAAAALGLEAEEVPLQPEDLFTANEAFLSSSVAGILPLTAVDGRAIGDGRPGAIALALRAARRRWIQAEVAGTVPSGSVGDGTEPGASAAKDRRPAPEGAAPTPEGRPGGGR
jgi:branched-chain amino acid aminotransferase